MFISLILLLLPLAKTANIISNIPVIVSDGKNYTSSSPTWLTSPYFRASYEDVIKVFTGSNVPSTDYTFTFSSALPGIPNLAYGIKNYRGNDYFGQEFYEIKKIGLTAATFSVSIQIFGVTNLWKLSVAYLAVDPTFPHHLNSFDNVPINATGGDIVNISTKTPSLTYYAQYINYTWQTEGRPFTKFTSPLSSNKIVLFMTSLWIRGVFGTTVQFHIKTDIINETFYKWNATLFKDVIITNVHFSQVIFNSDDVQSSKKYFIVYQLWYNDMNGGFMPIPQEFIDNFIMGVTTFQASSAACGFQYQWEYQNQTINGVSTFGVNILLSWTLTNTCGFNWSETSIFYMMTWSCQAPYYYFNLTSGLCQTLCGGFNFENQTALTCDPCSDVDCYQCHPDDPSFCFDCASYLHFQLVDGKCVCMSGFLHANSQCLPCDYSNPGCYNCSYDDGAEGVKPYASSNFSCLNCNNTQNYFLEGILCKKCVLSNCVYCQNLTACKECANGYNFSSIQTCIFCHITGCLYCSMTDSNVCDTCYHQRGYYEVAATKQCKTICGDGIYVSANQQCDDGNLINYDGCSSTCTIQAHFDCFGYPKSGCFFTESETISIYSQVKESSICDTVTFGFSLNPPSDTFAQPSINWEYFLSSPNDSILQLNSSMLRYSSGIFYVSYFLLAHLQNQSLIFEANFTNLISNSSIFANTTAPTITFEVSTVPAAMMECCYGFFMSTEAVRCDQICGDGILFVLPCDDGNLENGDGCSSVCTIEKDYVCMNGSISQSSICSYNGTISVALQIGDKNPKSNSLTLTYTVEPSGPLFSLNNKSTDFSSLVSFPSDSGVIIKSVILNPDTNQLFIEIDYTKKLQDTELSLQITPPNVPQAFLVPKLSQKWMVSPTNQLSAVVYSEEDYKLASRLTVLANVLLGIYLSIAASTLIFRKFIGLELATLFQIGYLSLLQNTEITAYSQAIADWEYVFGYNRLYLSPLPKERIDSPYALYGYKADFGFSNNLMIILGCSVFGVAAILFLLSMLTAKSTSRRLKNGAVAVANEVGYALVVFSTPNIINAICIEAKQGVFLTAEYIWSKALLISAVLMMLVTHAINLSFAQENSDVGIYLRKHSKMGIYMPAIFNLRLVIITTLLFVYHQTDETAQYFILITQLAYVLYTIFGRPHKKIIDLARSICLQVGLLYALMMRFIEIKVLAEYVTSDSNLYPILAYLQYAFYALGNGISTVALIYHIVKFLKGKKKVDPQPQPQLLNESPSPERQTGFSNQSISKAEPSYPSKRKVMEQNTLIFDIQEMTADVPNVSSISFDPKTDIKRIRASRRSKEK